MTKFKESVVNAENVVNIMIALYFQKIVFLQFNVNGILYQN